MIDIRPLDFASRRDVDAWHRLESRLHELVWPDNPPRSRDALVLEHENVPEFATVIRWLAWRGDEPVGHANVRWRMGVDNQHLAVGYVGVLPEWRRRKIGTRLTHACARAATGAGRTSMIFDSDSRAEPGASFLERLGGKKSLVARNSRVAVADLDLNLLRTWIREGESRAEAFEIVLWDDRVPTDQREAFAALLDVMNSAPYEDLDVEPFVHTSDHLVAYEVSRLARGMRWWCAVARHRDTGELAGFTDMVHTADDPAMLYQGGTGVWPKYRRNGLGRRLKALNALRVLQQAPAAKWIETESAGSNRAMLVINEAMGFSPYKQITAWQFAIPALLDRTGGPHEDQDASRATT